MCGVTITTSPHLTKTVTTPKLAKLRQPSEKLSKGKVCNGRNLKWVQELNLDRDSPNYSNLWGQAQNLRESESMETMKRGDMSNCLVIELWPWRGDFDHCDCVGKQEKKCERKTKEEMKLQNGLTCQCWSHILVMILVMVLVLTRRTDMVSVFRVGFWVLYVVNVGVRHWVHLELQRIIVMRCMLQPCWLCGGTLHCWRKKERLSPIDC